MDADARAQLEREVRRRFDAGDLDGGMTAALEGYGPELFGFLRGLARDHDQAADAFGAACERMWKALPRFRWDSSFRVWAYTIARHEFLRTTRHAARARRDLPISQLGSVDAIVARGRSATPAHARTDVKDRFAALRAELAPEDHMLLGLRLDRRMEWREIAQVLGSGDPAAQARDAATLRKRYERLKGRLRELVRAG